MSTTRHNAPPDPFAAVVVVGSQGALQSFSAVLSELPASFPAAVVFDLHRTEGFGLTEHLLARRGALPVVSAADGAPIDSSTLYIAPHNRQLTISDERLMRITGSGSGTGHRFADELLASGARALGPRVIAVVLSGRLHGGARGVGAVKHHGGRVIVEDPATAVAPSMPRAALATGCVDFALPPEGIANALVAMCAAAGAAELFRVRLNTAVTVAG